MKTVTNVHQGKANSLYIDSFFLNLTKVRVFIIKKTSDDVDKDVGV